MKHVRIIEPEAGGVDSESVMFGAAVGRVSSFNQKNGKMIVFVLGQLVHTDSLFYSQVQNQGQYKIRARLIKSGVTNHVQILQDR